MTVDTHVHLFDPARFPYRPDALHTPGPGDVATLDDLLATMAGSDVSHAVLIGPTAGYGPDNACLLDGLKRGGDRLRGIAVLSLDVGDVELDAMSAAGVVGARFDLIARGTDHLVGVAAGLLDRLVARDWIIDVQCRADQLPALLAVVERGGRFVIDHGGRPDPSRGLDQPGFAALLGLARTGRVWVKLSGPFRESRSAAPFADMDPYFDAIVTAYPASRLLWGSDWPFVRSKLRPTYEETLAWLGRRVRSDDARRTILTDTPRALFGWASDG